MFSRDKIIKETSPLSIFFVKSGCGGNRLLFRYPYDDQFNHAESFGQPFELAAEQDLIQFQKLINENDEALCNMFSVNPNLCGQKFEIKINSVRHVGHPMSLLTPSQTTTFSSQVTPGHKSVHHNQLNLSLSSFDCLTAPGSNPNLNQGDITSFNIVCALRASASYDIVDCYHDLSRRLAIALSFEERRCSYLSKEIKTILTTLEERDMAAFNNLENEKQSIDKNSVNNDNRPPETEKPNESVYSLILERSNLVRDLKRVFDSLSITGIVDIKINNWVSVSFCLPQKVHRLQLMTHKSMPMIGTKDIRRCLLYLRPYHGILLLYEPQELLDSLPIDASPAFIQLIKVSKPDKNFMDLSVDANLSLMQIFCIVSQLLYWAKATVIYPICDSNIYAIHPLASTGKRSLLENEFRDRFSTSKSLHHYLAEFSEGTSLSQMNGPLINIEEKLNLLSIVTWLLQRRILTQVHKYIFFVVDKQTEQKGCQNQMNYFGQTNSDQCNSPNGIEISVPSNGGVYSNSNSSKVFWPGNPIESSPQILKESFSESFESSLKRYRADSLPESQEDSNYGLNSSLSSTPNSNLEYPSPSNDVDNKSSLSSSFNLDNTMADDGIGFIMSALQRADLSQAEFKNILKIPASKNPDDLKLLIRLIPYFDGKHHIEDIMFFENLERSQILILCDKFREALFTCHYEDVAVSQLSPFDSAR